MTISGNKTTAHMIVRNEEQWLWYGLQSVLPFVERILVFDTGSEDNSVKIIQKINSSKIYLLEKGKVAPEKLVELRNEQIERTNTPWFMLLDGDEVWPEETLNELEIILKKASRHLMGIVVRAQVPLGDLFHYQSMSAGRYQILGKRGHYNLRLYRKHKSYKWKGVYPLEAYTNEAGIPLQDETSKLTLLTGEYWHMTHLPRSSKDSHRKKKLELGEKTDLKLPEVFFRTRPKVVQSPWVSFSPGEAFAAQMLTPILKVKRSLLK